MKTVVLDLETIPNPAIIPLLPEPEAKANLKDPEKIAADIEEKRMKLIEEMALNPHCNLICCCSMYDIDSGETKSIMLPADGSGTEKDLLLQVWDTFHCFDRFVTFNGNAFDIPVLRFHSMIHRVIPSVNISTAKYRIENHIDCRAILGDYSQFAKGNLDWYCKIILGADNGKTEGCNGAMVQHLWDCGCYSEIKEYCENDVRILAQLYRRMEGYYF